MISTTGKELDVILISGEYYDDHPLSPVGIIARVLDAKGYRVGIIEKPETKADFIKLGAPKLFFGVTSGSIDSMLYNYTPLKRKRSEDPTQFITKIPERAVIFYCNKLREYFKNCMLVIGGVEASLRRFAHYDYWDNKIRKSILLDSRANILVYGNGEKQIIEIAKRVKEKKELLGIEGTCILSKSIPTDDKLGKFELLPAFTDVKDDDKDSKVKFCQMQIKFSNDKNLAQKYDHNYVLQYKFPRYTSEELDWSYSLPYSRKMHPITTDINNHINRLCPSNIVAANNSSTIDVRHYKSLLEMAKFSVVTHRGCIGRCNFCSITLHQGDKIVSRSEKSILDEIKHLTKHPDFKGYIDDLGGPSANMYGMDCATRCVKNCLDCKKLDVSHGKLIQLLRKARQIPGVKKIFIRSGIRYDLALENKEYIKEVSEHHISGCLKIAPEHFSTRVLSLMNKDNSRFDEFKKYFEELNKTKKQSLKYYFMVGHPGDDETETAILVEKMKQLQNVEQFQLFTPTPMTDSTCMYWTGMNPYTLQSVKVVYDFIGKKKLRDMVLKAVKDRKM